MRVTLLSLGTNTHAVCSLQSLRLSVCEVLNADATQHEASTQQLAHSRLPTERRVVQRRGTNQILRHPYTWAGVTPPPTCQHNPHSHTTTVHLTYKGHAFRAKRQQQLAHRHVADEGSDGERRQAVDVAPLEVAA
jgi:hypothetical protein